jgi:general secretion pathway protein C
MKRWPLITSFILIIALCVSAVYWVMQLFKPAVRSVAAHTQTILPTPSLEAAAGLFGGHLNTVIASNFQLIGVIVASNPAESVAILAADGKPAQAIRVNAEVMLGVTVKEVNKHHVLLSEGGVIKQVELPEKTKAQIGVGLSTNATGAGSPPLPNSSNPSGK